MYDPFEDRYPSTDPWDVIAAMEAGKPYSSSELSELIDVPRRTVHKHLRDFFRAGVVDRKSIGPGVAWYIDPDTVAEIRDIAPSDVLGTEGSNGGATFA